MIRKFRCHQILNKFKFSFSIKKYFGENRDDAKDELKNKNSKDSKGFNTNLNPNDVSKDNRVSDTIQGYTSVTGNVDDTLFAQSSNSSAYTGEEKYLNTKNKDYDYDDSLKKFKDLYENKETEASTLGGNANRDYGHNQSGYGGAGGSGLFDISGSTGGATGFTYDTKSTKGQGSLNASDTTYSSTGNMGPIRKEEKHIINDEPKDKNK